MLGPSLGVFLGWLHLTSALMPADPAASRRQHPHLLRCVFRGRGWRGLPQVSPPTPASGRPPALGPSWHPPHLIIPLQGLCECPTHRATPRPIPVLGHRHHALHQAPDAQIRQVSRPLPGVVRTSSSPGGHEDRAGLVCTAGHLLLLRLPLCPQSHCP